MSTDQGPPSPRLAVCPQTPLPASTNVVRMTPDSKATVICDLPHDMLFEICRYLTASDIVSVLSTCTALHIYMHESSIWQRFCAHYGVQELSQFPGRSFYIVYTQLLHPYGPLIGLWASDHPYWGNIVEFRLADDERYSGIIGEVWRFPDSETANGPLPSMPLYERVLIVGFDAPPNSSRRSRPLESGVSIFCDMSTESNMGASLGDSGHAPSIEVLPSDNQAYRLQDYREKHTHPGFPRVDSEWHDKQRILPRLKPCSPVSIDQSELVRIYPAVRLPIIFTAPTDWPHPPAIAIECPVCAHKLLPQLPFDDLSPLPRRYYPLKCDIRDGVDPDSEDWTQKTLVGLWLGPKFQGGTEVLHLGRYERDLRVYGRTYDIIACKITGDAHVPRGALNWVLYDRPPFETIHARRAYRGAGAVSRLGYRREMWLDLIINIVEKDKIVILWEQLNITRTYIRYRGRDTVVP